MDNNYRTRTDYIVVHSTKTKPSENLNAKDMSGAILPINQPLITNQNSIAIALVGGLADDGKSLDTNFTYLQYASLRELVKRLKKKYKVEVVGCRNAINSKSCMSFDVLSIVD